MGGNVRLGSGFATLGSGWGHPAFTRCPPLMPRQRESGGETPGQKLLQLLSEELSEELLCEELPVDELLGEELLCDELLCEELLWDELLCEELLCEELLCEE